MNKKQFLLHIIKHSPILRNELTFQEHIDLFKGLYRLPNEKVNQLYDKLTEAVTPPKTNPKLQKILSTGLAIATIPFAIPGLMLAVQYLSDINHYRCSTRCDQIEKDREINKSLCYRQCKFQATKLCVDYLEQELKKCSKTKNPKKCRKKINSLLQTWHKKAIEQQTRLHYAERKSRYKAQRTR